jgi:hypothetical protein
MEQKLICRSYNVMQIQIICIGMAKERANTSDRVRSQFVRVRLGDRCIDIARSDNSG